MRCHVVNVLLELPVQRGAEPASPCLPLLRILDDRLGVRTCLAPVGALVMLVERIGSPEALVTVRTRIFPPPLVEFLQVPLPIEFPLECLLA